MATLLIVSCGSGSGGGSGPELAGTIEPDTSLRANYNGIDYPIQVYLPATYANNPTQNFPVQYVLDGEWRFDLVVDLVDELAKPVVVVGIGNTDQLVEGQRAIDYRMPGAQDYYEFLVTAVLPCIEQKYTIDVLNRTLSGHSYGGLFVGLALLLEDPGNRYFANYLSQDGSFWYQPGVTASLEQQLSTTTNSLPVRMILSGATSGNGPDVAWYSNLLETRNYTDFDLILWRYLTNHEGQYLPSMEDALKLLY